MTVSVHGLPPLMREGLRLAVVPPPLKEDRWHVVRSASVGAGPGQLVTLSGVHDLGSAQALVGKVLLAARDELPEDLALHDVDALLGHAVRDAQSGATGAIDEVYQGPANDVWTVVMRDEPRGVEAGYLIPVIDEVVDGVPDEGPIPIRIPAGLEPAWTRALRPVPEQDGAGA